MVGVIIHCQVEDEKKLRGHAFLAEKLPKVLGGLEGLLSERGGNYFVGNKVQPAAIQHHGTDDAHFSYSSLGLTSSSLIA